MEKFFNVFSCGFVKFKGDHKINVRFIMVIELSGVQFGPKSLARFQNRMSAHRLEFASMISDQNCTTRSSNATLLDPF